MLIKKTKNSAVFKTISIVLVQAFFVSNLALAAEMPAKSALAPPLRTAPGEIIDNGDDNYDVATYGKSIYGAWTFFDISALIGQMLKITEEKRLRHPKDLLIRLLKKHITNREGWPEVRLEGYRIDELEEIRDTEGKTKAFVLRAAREGGPSVAMTYSLTKDDTAEKFQMGDPEKKETLYTVYVKAEPEDIEKAERIGIVARTFSHGPATNVATSLTVAQMSVECLRHNKALKGLSEELKKIDVELHAASVAFSNMVAEAAEITRKRLAYPHETRRWTEVLVDTENKLYSIRDMLDEVYAKYTGPYSESINADFKDLREPLSEIIEIMDNRVRFAKGTVMKEKLDVKKLIKEAIKKAYHTGKLNYSAKELKRKISIINKSGKRLFLYGDRISLVNALANIIINALYLPASERGKRDLTLDIEIRKEGDSVSISLDDKNGGIGKKYLEMGPNGREKLYDLNFTTKGEEGSGLGTTETYYVVRDHSGSIKIDTTPGVGTTFTLTLPDGEAPRRAFSSGGHALVDEENLEGMEKMFTEDTVASLRKGAPLTHGNGPQAGMLLGDRVYYMTDEEIDRELVEKKIVETTQSDIGESFKKALMKKGVNEEDIEIIITPVLVGPEEFDPKSPKFKGRTKPIGEKVEGRRRPKVVSPTPLHILKIKKIADAIKRGKIVICVGGGGIPMSDGKVMPGIIDKDLATALLARELRQYGINIDELVITTNEPYVYTGYGKENKKPLTELTLSELKQLLANDPDAKEFFWGSMRPKMLAAVDFLENGGQTVHITTPENMNKPRGTFIRNPAGEKKEEKPEEIDKKTFNELRYIKHDLNNSITIFYQFVANMKKGSAYDSRLHSLYKLTKTISNLFVKLGPLKEGRYELADYISDLRKVAGKARKDFSEKNIGPILEQAHEIYMRKTGKDLSIRNAVACLLYIKNVLNDYFPEFRKKSKIRLNSMIDASMIPLSGIRIEETVEENLAAGNPEIVTDEAALMRAFANIAQNAADAINESHDKGKLYISTRMPEGENYVEIVFKDTAKGIPPDILPDIFKPDVSTKEKIAFAERGLGLAIARRCIEERCGGTIEVDSLTEEEYEAVIPGEKNIETPIRQRSRLFLNKNYSVFDTRMKELLMITENLIHKIEGNILVKQNEIENMKEALLSNNIRDKLHLFDTWERTSHDVFSYPGYYAHKDGNITQVLCNRIYEIETAGGKVSKVRREEISQTLARVRNEILRYHEFLNRIVQNKRITPGTTFTIRLPAAENPAASPTPEQLRQNARHRLMGGIDEGRSGQASNHSPVPYSTGSGTGQAPNHSPVPYGTGSGTGQAPEEVTPESERAQVTELERAIDAVKYEIAKQEKAHEKTQTTMVALSKTWIKELLKGRFKSIKMNELIIHLRQFCEANGIPFIDEEDDALLAGVTERITRDGIKNPKVIILTGQNTLERPEYEALKADKSYYLFGIDSKNMTENNYIRLTEMIRLALNIVTTGRPQKPTCIDIKGEGRFYIFIPPAEPMGWENLRELYKVQICA